MVPQPAQQQQAKARGSRRPSLVEACATYVNRYTMEHVPAWARRPLETGKFYAPQYRSDAEWYANTVFPGEPGVHGNSRHCYTSGQTWPLGQWLTEAYRKA
jgi:hypothetical protein